MATQSSGHGTHAERPVALVAQGPRGGRVAACSSAAAGQGVHPGMALAEAQALAPQLALAPHEPAADRRALEKLAEACEQFTPRVALEESDEPECLMLDISDLEHLHGSERALVHRVKKFLAHRGYHARTAVADTAGQAWALAHSEKFPNDEIRMTNEKSHSSSVIRHSSLTHDLPVETLRIPDDTAALLRQLGVQTIAQLQALPREDLAARLGDELLCRLDQFTGAAHEVLPSHRGLPPHQVACALDEPTADRELILHVLSQLVERLACQLAARDEGAVRLTCKLGSTGGTPGVRDGRGPYAMSFAEPQDVPPEPENNSPAVQFQIGLLEPSANARQLMELIELHLENVRLADEIDRAELRAAVVGRLGQRQRELFADLRPTDPHQLALLVNRLGSRLGHERVLRAELRASPVPERAARCVPMTEGTRRKGEGGRRKVRGKRNSKVTSPSPLRLPPSPLPLLLHPEPQPLEVLCVSPDGPPQFVWLEGRRQQIAHCTGPERIETLWWRGPSVRRDYYRVATESAGHLWIFRRLPDARWFLHGAFD